MIGVRTFTLVTLAPPAKWRHSQTPMRPRRREDAFDTHSDIITLVISHCLRAIKTKILWSKLMWTYLYLRFWNYFSFVFVCVCVFLLFFCCCLCVVLYYVSSLSHWCWGVLFSIIVFNKIVRAHKVLQDFMLFGFFFYSFFFFSGLVCRDVYIFISFTYNCRTLVRFCSCSCNELLTAILHKW